MKRAQNIIAESKLTLPVTAVFSFVVWLLSGLVEQRLWLQLACLASTVYLLVELTNQNALLRVRSRMVSSTFIMLSSSACFLIPQLTGAVVQLCVVATFFMLFQTYQDSQAVGRTYFAFMALGLSTLLFVQMLWYVPVLWVLMATQLQSLSWRSWWASLLGLATPYWFLLLWLVSPFQMTADAAADLSFFGQHFSQLAEVHFEEPTLTAGRIAVFAVTLVLAVAGMIHFQQYSFEDKIRIRLLYGFFTTVTIVTLLFIIAQPHHFDVLLPLCFVCASPLIAHVFTFTATRLSNILFFAALAVVIGVTVYNLLHL